MRYIFNWIIDIKMNGPGTLIQSKQIWKSRIKNLELHVSSITFYSNCTSLFKGIGLIEPTVLNINWNSLCKWRLIDKSSW